MNTRIPATYDTDFAAWASEQAALLRAGRSRELDLDNIAEEIEDLSNSLKHALGNRLDHLIAHLLKWRYQPDHRTPSWRRTIDQQRLAIGKLIERAPSLRARLSDTGWLATQWRHALREARSETHLVNLPAELPWTMDELLDENFFPEE